VNEIVAFKKAEAPHKEAILAMLDEVRADVESGLVVALVMLPILTGNAWRTMITGDVKVLELGGMLGRAWLDVMERTRG
jgi:hypothetical protein